MLQEAADGPVVQEAVMALARAVQQLESRSLSRLDDLGAQLRPPDPEAQPEPRVSARGMSSPPAPPLSPRLAPREGRHLRLLAKGQAVLGLP